MKKLLKLFTGILMLSSSTNMLVSCSAGSGSYEEIKRPDPVYPFQKKGFEKFQEDKLDISKYVYTYDLIKDVNNAFEIAGYNLDNLNYTVYRNASLLEKSLDDNLLRNGIYKFIVTNKLAPEDELIFQMNVTNSRYLPDIVRTLKLGDINDNRKKTVLMKMMFMNLTLIKFIDEIAEEMLKEDANITIEENEAIINFGDFDKEKRKSFYGEVILEFNIKKSEEPWPGEKDINELAGEDAKNELGVLSSKKPFSIIMQYITLNFASRLDLLGILINDLNIEGAEIKSKGSNKFTATIKTREKVGNDEYPTKLKGTLELIFTYFET